MDTECAVFEMPAQKIVFKLKQAEGLWTGLELSIKII